MGVTTSYPSYGGNGPLILGLSWSFCIVASVLVGLRAWKASMLSGRLRWDFFWVAVAFVIAVAAQVLVTLSVLHGIGNHEDQIVSVEDAKLAALYNWMFEIILIVDITIVKIAIIAFLIMIQGTTYPKMRYFLHFIWISNMILSINQIILILVSCKPLPKFWNFTLHGQCNYRPTTSKVGFLQGGWGAASDLALAIYPVYIYWHLQMSWHMRLGLCALTGGGVIACAAAILKTIYIALINSSNDITYSFTDLIIWISVEQWLIIILSSIPPLRQFFGRIYGKTTTVLSSSRSRNNTHITGPTSERHEIELRLNPYPSDTSYKARMCAKSEAVDETMWEDNESQEGILPGRNEIWMTRETTVRREGEMTSRPENV